MVTELQVAAHQRQPPTLGALGGKALTASCVSWSAPTVAFATEATRFAWRSLRKMEETKSCTQRADGLTARIGPA